MNLTFVCPVRCPVSLMTTDHLPASPLCWDSASRVYSEVFEPVTNTTPAHPVFEEALRMLEKAEAIDPRVFEDDCKCLV